MPKLSSVKHLKKAFWAKAVGVVIIVLFSVYSIFALKFEAVFKSLFPQSLSFLTSYPSYFEDRFFDIRMNQTLDDQALSNHSVLLAIDDISLQKIGRWPWTRTVFAQIVDKMKILGAKVVAFDVVFPEEEVSCRPEDSPDYVFQKSIKNFNKSQHVVLSYSLTYPESEEAMQEVPDALFDQILDSVAVPHSTVTEFAVDKNTFPIEKLLSTDSTLSYIGAQSDADGIFRRYPLVAKIDGLYLPSYSLAAYQAFTGDQIKLKELQSGDVEFIFSDFIKKQENKLLLSPMGETKIRWLGGKNAFPTYSINDLYQLDLKDEKSVREWQQKIAGKIVFIGSTAFASHDIRHTPVDATLPGVYYHMNMTEMLLRGQLIKPVEETIQWSFILVAIGLALVILAQLIPYSFFDLLVVILFSVFIIILDLKYFLPQGYQLTLFFILLSVILTHFWITLINFYLANKDKAFLKQAFGTYIAPELIDQMYQSGQTPSLGGESGERTAFFTDIQGFSTFSEMLSAAKLVELLNEYLSAMTDILLSHQGTLDKYEGDAIIAFFGAPVFFPHHAQASCQVALRMQEALAKLRQKWVSENDKWPQIVHQMRMRIGINTGEMVTGNMGSKLRMNYTMMGDAVNLAARLEEAAKQYGIYTHIAQNTFEQIDKKHFVYRKVDRLRVVGKREPITTYELIGFASTASPAELQLVEIYNQGMIYFEQRDFLSAKNKFEASLALEDREGKKTCLSEIYLKRCEAFIKNPPPLDWDGVFELTHK